MRTTRSMASHSHRSARRIAQALLLSVTLSAAAPVSGVQPPAAADPTVINTWNQAALLTLTTAPPAGPGKVPPEVFLYLAFVHTAMYNAVVGITGEYELYRWNARAPKGASPEAAAAAAAHRVLRTYFGHLGTLGANLDATLATSLGAIPDGVAKDQGIRYGQRAADHLIAMRANDGRNAVVEVPDASQPGDWSPTPPANLGFLNPWYGYIDPLLVPSVAAFDPGMPPQIGTERYRTEFAEVRDFGAAVSSVRTSGQEMTARFFADTPVGPMQFALRDFAARHALDISDRARLFAAAETSIADALAAVWWAKHKYMWWRPITAIRAADDGDPLTDGVPGWTPLITTPPYPEWPSGLCSVIGAVSTVVSRLNGGQLDLFITSPAAGTRHYVDPSIFEDDAVDARVWSGIHFRKADEVSIIIGNQVGNYALDHYFAPAD